MMPRTLLFAGLVGVAAAQGAWVWEFRMWDATTDEPIPNARYATDHTNPDAPDTVVQFDLATHGVTDAANLNLECRTTNTPDYVQMYVNGTFQRRERRLPYMFFGDIPPTNETSEDGDISIGNWQVNETYVVSCVGYKTWANGPNAGVLFEGRTETIIITVVDSGGAFDPDAVPVHPVNEDPTCLGTPKEGGTFCAGPGLAVIEAESFPTTAGWLKTNSIADATGGCYMEWTGNNFFTAPGAAGLTSVDVTMATTGEYRLVMRSFILTEINNPTEHNDLWLRLLDANGDSVLFGYASDSKVANNENVIQQYVWPRGDLNQSAYKGVPASIPPVWMTGPGNRGCCNGRRPHGPPGIGVTTLGWVKLFRHGPLGFWDWKTTTGDDQGYSVYAWLEAGATYTIEISGRSTGHSPDRFVLHDDSYTFGQAQSLFLPESPLCTGIVMG